VSQKDLSKKDPRRLCGLTGNCQYPDSRFVQRRRLSRLLQITVRPAGRTSAVRMPTAGGKQCPIIVNIAREILPRHAGLLPIESYRKGFYRQLA